MPSQTPTPPIAFVVASAAISIDRRLLPHMFVSIAFAIAQIFVPRFGLELLGVAGGVVLGMLSATWYRQANEPSGDG